MSEKLEHAEATSSRMFFIDNLRSAIIILVILRHVAVAYLVRKIPFASRAF